MVARALGDPTLTIKIAKRVLRDCQQAEMDVPPPSPQSPFDHALDRTNRDNEGSSPVPVPAHGEPQHRTGRGGWRDPLDECDSASTAGCTAPSVIASYVQRFMSVLRERIEACESQSQSQEDVRATTYSTDDENKTFGAVR